MLQLENYSVETKMLALSAFAQLTPRVFDHLLGLLGTLDEIYYAEAEDLAKIEGLTPSQRRLIGEVGEHLDQTVQLQRVLEAQGIQILCRYHDQYRQTLNELNDPPLLLYIRGTLPPIENRTLGLIGPVDASVEGMGVASAIVRQLANKQVSVVSSLRGGMDAAVLLAARKTELPVIAITDGSIDIPIPDDMLPLFHEILSGGAVVTEFLKVSAMTGNPHEHANRLIAGLADGVGIVECHAEDLEVLDLISYCNLIGKLSFLLTDDKQPDLIDPSIRSLAVKAGAVPIGTEKINELVRVLV